MVQKRPFGDEELYEVSSKHPRQLEYGQLVSSLEFVHSEGVALKPHISGEDEGNSESKSEYNERLAKGVISSLPTPNEEIFNSATECISNSSWPTSSSSEEDGRLDIPFHFQFSPEYCHPHRPTSTFRSVDTYSSLFEYSPRKPISVGLGFQAIIPEWGPRDIENTSNCSATSEPSIRLPRASESDSVDSKNNENELLGTCIVPIPESEPSECDGYEVGGGGNDCHCRDMGSIRCARQHIVEAREKLMRNLGHRRFEELGFFDMGELVAEKWSEEDEQLFHEVVFSNPARLGKNFWDHLSMVFPFRTKKEIVSYYFNVFMLRKRAEQNRFDPRNIDSDNDEWQGSEDSGDDEVDTIYEDDDRLIEFPEYDDDPNRNDIYDEGDFNDHRDNYENVDCSGDKGITHGSETRSTKVLHFRSSDSTLELHGSGDNSCTSSNSGSEPQVVKTNDSNVCLGTANSVSGHGYVLEPYGKAWDVGYMSFLKNEEFLPTCSVIEEVFGVGSWNYKGRDGNDGLS